MNAVKLAAELGRTYSSLLKIDIKSKKESEIFKWFLASILFGKPIREETAIKTFQLFIAEKIDAPEKITRTGWKGLVDILDRGGYVRYDFSTATKLLEIMEKLRKDYKGKVTNIHAAAKDSTDLEKRLMEFKGVGPLTTNIFLRELRTVWKKADPEPCRLVKEAAKKLKISLKKQNRKTERFISLECTLLRKGIDLRRKGKLKGNQNGKKAYKGDGA